MAVKKLWDAPRLFLPTHDHSNHKSAGWQELFGDLIFVSIISELTHLLIAGFSPEDAAHRLLSTDHSADHLLFGLTPEATSVLLVAMFGEACWQIWVLDVTVTARFQGGEDFLGRFFNIVFMSAMVFLAGNVSRGWDGLGQICVSIAVAQCVVFARYTRGILSDPAASVLKLIIAPQLVFLALYLMSGVLALTGHTEVAVYALAGTQIGQRCFFIFNWLFGGLGKEAYYKLSTSLDEHYVVERFGLLQIIIIGETILSVVAGAKTGKHNAFDYVVVVMAFVVVYSNFWVYFDNVDEESQSTVTKHTRAFFVMNFHQMMMFANLALAAGINMLLSTKDEHALDDVAALCFYSYALLAFVQSANRIISVMTWSSIRENPNKFAMRAGGSLAIVVVLVILGACSHAGQVSESVVGYICILFGVALARIGSTYISSTLDYQIMRVEWEKEGVIERKTKPLIKVPHPNSCAMNDIDMDVSTDMGMGNDERNSSVA
jgi:low temperature requirement protein LtrA